MKGDLIDIERRNRSLDISSIDKSIPYYTQVIKSLKYHIKEQEEDQEYIFDIDIAKEKLKERLREKIIHATNILDGYKSMMEKLS